MRFLRRNALGIYAVYGASIVSGLIVTPITLHALGDQAFGIWAFIGSITFFLGLLDFGLGPSVVRFTAEARGRRAVEDTSRLASVALVLYAIIGVATLIVGAALAWFVPLLIDTPDDLVSDARLATFLVVVSLAARFPLGLVYNLLGGHQRFDVQNLGNFLATVLYALLVAILIPRGGGIVLLAALTLGVTLIRLGLPLLWLRREFPELAFRRAYVTAARVRELAAVSSSNFLVQIANKVVFSTDVVVVGIVLGAMAATHYAIPAKLFTLAFGLCSVGSTLLLPAFAEQEGSRDVVKQRRLLLTGLRASVAAALVLALPLLLIPDLLIEAWVGQGYAESSPVLSLLALVVLIHQPIFLFTNYLIARGLQQAAARTLLAAVAANVVLSVALAQTVGLWGVALATLVTDAAALAYLAPALVAPAAGIAVSTLLRVALRPVLPAAAAAVPVLVVAARAAKPDTLLELLPLGIAWAVVAGFLLWRFGFDEEQRTVLARTARGRPDAVPEPA